MSLDSLRALIASSILPEVGPEPNLSKTTFQGFSLFRNEPKAEPDGKSVAPSDSYSTPLSSSALASSEAPSVFASHDTKNNRIVKRLVFQVGRFNSLGLLCS